MPLLLVGPIIRRVDKTQVCIWIATSKAVYARVDIFKFKESNSNSVPSGDVDENIDKKLGPGFSQPDMQIIGSGHRASLKLAITCM